MVDGFLLDSDTCIYLLRGLSPVLTERVRQHGEGTLFVSAISLAEIGIGVRSRPDEALALSRFVDEVEVVAFDAAAARRYAFLPFSRGKYDRLIAAHALSLDLTLVTNNEPDFADIAGLRVENWTR